MIEWAVLGVLIGAAGSELLRTRKPELVSKVEQAARRLADSLYPAKPSKDGEAGQQ